MRRLKRHLRRFIRRPERFAIAGGVAICTLFFLSLGWLEMNKVARRRINHQLVQARERLGAPIEVGRITIGLGAAYFDDVRIGKQANVVISRVSAEIGVNPFRPTFGRLAAVTVEKMRIKSPTKAARIAAEDLGRHGLTGASDATPVRPESTTEKTIDRLFKALPTERLTVRSGVMTLVGDDGKPQVQIKGLELMIDRRARKALFKVASARDTNGLNERLLQGRLEMSPKGPDYRFFIRRKARAGAAPSPNAWALSGDLAKDLGSATVQFEAHRLPSFLQPHLVKLLGPRPRAHLAGGIKLKRQADTYLVDVSVKSHGTMLEMPVLSKTPVGPVRFALSATGVFRPASRLFAIETASVEIPRRARSEVGARAVRLAVSGALRLPTEERPGLGLQGQLHLASTDCQTALDASPAGLLPALHDFKLAGDIEGGVDFNFDGARPDSLYFELRQPRFDCRVTSEPYVYSAEHLSGPYALQREEDKATEVRGNEGDDDHGSFAAASITRLPRRPRFTPLAEIAGSVNLAFVASEDQGFYQHQGIDLMALENAIHRNFREGKIKVGGSTITMQTVKNLYLTHDRTITRKLQELFLAWHLEQVVSKERILEIYLNIVEFGPGIYGITQAAEHFFAKHPFDLTLAESAYLALLLPSPKDRYLYFCRGEVTPAFGGLMSGLLKRMLNLGRISYDRYAQAQASAETLRFNQAARAAATPICDTAAGGMP